MANFSVCAASPWSLLRSLNEWEGPKYRAPTTAARAPRTSAPEGSATRRHGDKLRTYPTRLVTGLPAFGIGGHDRLSAVNNKPGAGPSHDSGQLSATCTPDTRLGRFRAPPAVDGGVGRAQPGTGRSKGQPPPFGRKWPGSLCINPPLGDCPFGGQPAGVPSKGSSAFFTAEGAVKALTPAFASFPPVSARLIGQKRALARRVKSPPVLRSCPPDDETLSHLMRNGESALSMKTDAGSEKSRWDQFPNPRLRAMCWRARM